MTRSLGCIAVATLRENPAEPCVIAVVGSFFSASRYPPSALVAMHLALLSPTSSALLGTN